MYAYNTINFVLIIMNINFVTYTCVILNFSKRSIIQLNTLAGNRNTTSESLLWFSGVHSQANSTKICTNEMDMLYTTQIHELATYLLLLLMMNAVEDYDQQILQLTFWKQHLTKVLLLS